jgi:hypothetical protein
MVTSRSTWVFFTESADGLHVRRVVVLASYGEPGYIDEAEIVYGVPPQDDDPGSEIINLEQA